MLKPVFQVFNKGGVHSPVNIDSSVNLLTDGLKILYTVYIYYASVQSNLIVLSGSILPIMYDGTISIAIVMIIVPALRSSR